MKLLNLLFLLLTTSICYSNDYGQVSRKVDSLKIVLVSPQSKTAELQATIELARIYSDTKIDSSLLLSKKSLILAWSLDSVKLVAQSYLLIGTNYLYMGMNSFALENLQQAKSHFERLKEDTQLAETLKNIGNVFWFADDFSSALDYYYEALKIYHEKFTIKESSSIYINIGLTYTRLHQYDSALANYNKALDISRTTGYNRNIALTLLNICNVYYEMGQYKKALAYANNIEQNHIKSFHKNSLPEFYNTLPQIYIKLKDFKQAKRYLDSAYKYVVESKIPFDIERYYFVKFQYDSATNDINSALNSYILHGQYKDSISSSKFKGELANYKSLYELEQRQSKIDRLETENRLKDLKLKKNRLVTILACLVIVFLIILTLQFRQSVKIKSKSNQKLIKQREKLIAQKSELSATLNKLKLAQAQLVQSEKMASLGVLTAGIAHELNNPLNFIAGGLHVIDATLEEYEDKDIPQEKIEEAYKIINEGIERSTIILNALMTFSYHGKPVFQLSDVNEILENTLLFLRFKLIDNIEVEKDFKLDQKINLYQDKIHQVFVNIIDNAIFAVSNHPRTDKKIKIETKLSTNQNEIIIEISNNGGNISKELLTRLFDPFYTTKDPGEGTGLGLSIVYTIIQEHQGSIVASNTDEGVCFKITIPYNPN